MKLHLTIACLFLLVAAGLLTPSSIMAEIILTPGDIGPSSPAVMILDRTGLLLPRAESWIYSNVSIPYPVELQGATDVRVVVYFVPDGTTIGAVDFQVIINAMNVGDPPFYGGFTGTTTAVHVGGPTKIYQQAFTIPFVQDANDLFNIGIHRVVVLASTDTYPTGVYVNAIRVENASATAIREPGPGASIQLDAQPNPFRDGISVRYGFEAPQNAHLGLFDVQGRLLRDLAGGRYAAKGYEYYVDTRQLSQGIYFLKLATESGERTAKIVKIE
jgi:hypothetical protein